jgi:hypothetical protein
MVGPQIARVSFLAIAAQVAELERRDAVHFDDVRVPKLFVESARATVKVVGRVIGGERVVASVEMELRTANAARDASDDGAETRDNLVFAGKLMTYEVGIRFLTDHLQGDIYFKIKHPGHNLERARNQLRLVDRIEAADEALQAIVRKYRAAR